MAGRYLTAGLLLAAAALDLTRCGLVLATARPAVTAAWLISAGLAACALSLWTARACRAGWRWSIWAALAIGATSGPQAAASGFRGPYVIPDTATAVLGILLAVAVLATAGAVPEPGRAEVPPRGCLLTGDCLADGQRPGDQRASGDRPDGQRPEGDRPGGQRAGGQGTGPGMARVPSPPRSAIVDTGAGRERS